MDRRHFLTLAAALVQVPELTANQVLRSVAVGAQIAWIDTHVHPLGGKSGGDVAGGAGPHRGARAQGDESSAVSNAAAAMDGSGITTMFLLPPPQIFSGLQPMDYSGFMGPASAYGGRFRFLGGGGTLNPLLQQMAGSSRVDDSVMRQFKEQAEGILRAGAVGIGEMAAHHLSLVPGHPYESVPSDHPLLLQLADLAARHNVPIDLHFDPVVEEMARPDWAPASNPAVLPANFAAFERLLAHNRTAKIIWAHAGSDNLGQWTVELSHRMLATHPNLFMSLRMTPGHAFQNHPLTKEGEIKPGWLRLLSDFSDRFVIGGDQFFVDAATMNENWKLFASRAGLIRQRTNILLSLLPERLAHEIAQANATRLYRL
jgi:hypothetical protein